MRLRPTLAALAVAATPVLTATPAFADIRQMEADGDVMTVFMRLETAVAEAGATIFARVDHGAGAQSAEMELNDSKLLIFGNPKLGTPAMQGDMLAGLQLPLKMLVYADDDGQTWVAYEEVDEIFDDLDVDDDAEWYATMENVLNRFATAAAGG